MFIDQNPQSSRTFSPSDYPHTYVASTGNKIAATLLSFVLAGGSAIILWIGFDRSHGDTTTQYILLAALAIPLVLFPLLALATYRFKVVLHPDRIDYQGLFSSWSIRRDQISKWRLRTVNGNQSLALTSAGPVAEIRKCTLQFKPDAAFAAWFAGLPNADLVELKESEEEIAQDPAFGSTPEERLNAAARARKIARISFFIALVVPYWAIFYPHPYNLPVWICLAAPWIAITVCRQSKGLYTLGGLGKKSAKADLTMSIIMMSGFGLMMYAIRHMSMLHWTQALVPGVIVGLIFTILLGLTNHWFAKTLTKAIPSILFCSGYAVVGIIVTNTLLDASVPVSYPVKILAQRQTHGKGAASYLTVSGWGPRTTSNELIVNHTFYDSKTPGDVICVHLHDGMYRMQWFGLGDCTSAELAVERERNASVIESSTTHASASSTNLPELSLSIDGDAQPIEVGTPRAWALAADALLTAKGGMRHDLLGGWQRVPDVQATYKRVLSTSWGIYDRIDLLQTLTRLEEHGHRDEFERLGRVDKAFGEHQYLEAFNQIGVQDIQNLNRLKFAHNYYKLLGTKSLLSFDLVRAINLSRWGYLVGYISEDEAWQHIMKSAKILRTTYGSWQDLSENYLLGREFWGGDPDGNGDMQTISQNLLQDATGPWTLNRWNIDLR